MQVKSQLYQSAQYVKGVGPRKYKLLNKLGVWTIEDLLWFLPRRYEDRSKITSISHLETGQYYTIKGRVITFELQKAWNRMQIFRVAVDDETGVIFAVWFNQPYMKDYFKIGDQVMLYGKVEKYKNSFVINVPDFENLSGNYGREPVDVGRIVPVYPLTQDLSQRAVRQVLKRVVDQYSSLIPEILPTDIIRRNDLLPLNEAIRNIHFAESLEKKDTARKRLVFDEFFILQIGIALKKAKIKFKPKGVEHQVTGQLVEMFEKSLKFKLTNAQQKAIKEIKNDMKSNQPMNRLLQGDVGSGKTIVAAYALTLSVQSGFQSAIMVPTEILAEQHYLNLAEILMPLGITTTLLIGNMSSQMKDKVLTEILTGEANVVVGTHTLLNENLKFNKLGLVIIDEQHKFGVKQRAVLREKGDNPDVLVMTATPIPRTLALTVYGDLDISVIDELPPGRIPVQTYSVGEDKRKRIYDFIKQQIKQGRQAYIVYPLVEKSDKIYLKSAVSMYEQLKKEVFAEYKIGLIHGKLSVEQKDKIMEMFKRKEIDILVSTVVIEVGIDVPNASVMVVENAERFGLSQLHQLRGRIGRGRFNSYCILISDTQTQEGAKRLSAMVDTYDGFKIAEEDLEIRGPGEFFGTRQHGLPEIKIGNIVADMKILELAKREAFNLIKQDPLLKRPANSLIKAKLKQKFSDKDIDLVAIS